MEGQAVHPLDLVLMKKQPIQSLEASERVLIDAPKTVSMQEKMAQVVEVHENVILEELQMIFLRRHRDHTRKLLHKYVQTCNFRKKQFYESLFICGPFSCLLYLQVEILQTSEALKDVIRK